MADAVRQLGCLAIDPRPGAHLQHTGCGALHIADEIAPALSQQGHALAPAVERQFIDDGRGVYQSIHVQTCLDCQGHKSGFGWVAKCIPVRVGVIGRVGASVAGQQSVLEERPHPLKVPFDQRTAVFQNIADCLVASAGDLVAVPVRPGTHDSHLVAGNGAGFRIDPYLGNTLRQ